MNTTVPWFPFLLVAVLNAAAIGVHLVEKRRQRSDGRGWGGPGWK